MNEEPMDEELEQSQREIYDSKCRILTLVEHVGLLASEVTFLNGTLGRAAEIYSAIYQRHQEDPGYQKLAQMLGDILDPHRVKEEHADGQEV